MINACPYTIDLDNDANRKFKALMKKEYGVVAGFYAAGLYINGQVVEEALKELHGDTSDKEKTIAALRAVKLADTPRGPLHFDHLGNVVGNIYIRRVEKMQNGQLTNMTVKTYDNVSQFWTYDEKKYLSQPAYSRDFPPLKS